MSEQRLIDANAIYDKVEANYRMSEGLQHVCEREFLNLICDAPTVDAAPVVRCRECKYAHLTYDGDIKYCDLLAAKDEYGDCDPCFYRSGDWFCADGERRSDGEQ